MMNWTRTDEADSKGEGEDIDKDDEAENVESAADEDNSERKIVWMEGMPFFIPFDKK
jgi:hypothetical protein